MSAVRERWDVELSAVEAAVGRRSFDRGRAYANRGRVLRLAWDAEGEALTGSVLGQGALYDTTAFFADGREGSPAFDEGECTCPVGYNCKHVAALVIAAVGGPERRLLEVVPPPAEAAWERPLRALIEAPAAQATGRQLGIELSLQRSGLAGEGARLQARLLRPGARGGWVNGSLTWSGLDSWQVRSGEYRADHLALVRELYALQRAHEGHSYYWYSRNKMLDLTDYGTHLWALLDEAARIGLPLLDVHTDLGELPPYRRGEIRLDVTRSDDDHSLLRALLLVEGGERVEPELFLGASGHGLVGADDRGRLRLVRLDRPAPPELQRLVLGGKPLSIPPDELERFGEEICPALRSIAAVGSSDDSFTPPEVSAPSLVLAAHCGMEHAVEVAWEWVYQVGERERRAPVGPPAGGAGFRDLGAERALLAGTVLAATGLERYGLLDEAGRPTGGAVTLTGLDGMHFATQLLPRLRELPGVTVETEGQPPDYRDVSESLTIGVSTTEIAGERDWFDLGVSIRVEGRELPFAEVFVALASGQSHMLLRRRRLLLAAGAAAAVAPRADRGGPRAPGHAVGAAPHQPLPGRALVGARRARRRDGAGAGLAAPGRRAARARRTRRARAARDASGRAAPLPAGGLRLARRAVGTGAGRDPRRRHGSRQDAADARARLPRPRRTTRTPARSSWSRRRASSRPGSREAARFAPSSERPRRHRHADEVGPLDRASSPAPTSWSTTYTLLRLDADAYRTVAWAGLVLDEAQYVKNHQAKTYRCVRELDGAVQARDDRNADGEQPDGAVVAPVDHRPRAVPRPEAVRRATTRGRSSAPATPSGSPACGAGSSRSSSAARKELVAAELPAKQEQTILVDLHARHRKVYDTHLQRERQKILGLLGDFDRNRFTILRSITLLRQLSLHPGLVNGGRRRRPLREARRARRAAPRYRRRRPPGARVQPVHPLPRPGPRLVSTTRASDTATSTAAPAGASACSSASRSGDDPGLPAQPQGRRIRAQPDRGRLLLPARPVVEPRHREPGDRPHPPHRPDPPGDGLPDDRPRHDRGEGRRARAPQSRAVPRRAWTRATSSPRASPPTTSAACSNSTFTATVKELPKISTKNQVTIPVAVLDEAGMHAGDPVVVEALEEGELRIRRRAISFESAFGALTGAYPAGYLEQLDREDERR